MKKTIYLYWHIDKFEPEGYACVAVEYSNFEKCFPGEYRLLASTEVEFDVPALDPREYLLESLKQQKDKIIQDATRQAKQLEEEIQQLLALDAPVDA